MALLLGLDVEDADDLVVPGQRHAQHRGDEPALVDSADPEEARVGSDVGDDEGLAARGDAARHAFSEWHPRATDLEAIEAVRRSERQVGSIPIQQVQRGDVGVEGIAGPVDDRFEELVPGPRSGREARDLMQEPELLKLVRSASRVEFLRSHGHHDTSLRVVEPAEGCSDGPGGLWNGARARERAVRGAA